MPEAFPLVVCNTTPLVALFLLGRLKLLKQLYGNIIIPPAVHQEFLSGRPSVVRAEVLEQASWIQVINLNSPRRAELLAGLDRGEAEVITLAEEQNATLVIMDEKLGRRYVRRLGLPLTGTLGVLLRARGRGLVKSIKPLVESLIEQGFYLGDALVEEALRLAQEGE
jgi:hypothetical protein